MVDFSKWLYSHFTAITCNLDERSERWFHFLKAGAKLDVSRQSNKKLSIKAPNWRPIAITSNRSNKKRPVQHLSWSDETAVKKNKSKNFWIGQLRPLFHLLVKLSTRRLSRDSNLVRCEGSLKRECRQHNLKDKNNWEILWCGKTISERERERDVNDWRNRRDIIPERKKYSEPDANCERKREREIGCWWDWKGWRGRLNYTGRHGPIPINALHENLSGLSKICCWNL